MSSIQLIAEVPLWVFMLVYAAILLIAMVVGRSLSRFVKLDPATVGSGQLLVGAFSVLSLLIGFTFSLALNRHDQRIDLLLEEANSIRNLQRVLVHVAEPSRTEISKALKVYALGRLEFVESNLVAETEQRAARALEREEMTRLLLKMVPVPESGLSMFQTMGAATRLLDSATHLEKAMMEHVPARVGLVLYLLSTGSALLVGLSLSANLAKLWLPAVIWSFLLSAAIFTVVDLDAPHWGSIRLESEPLRAAIAHAENPVP